MDGLDPIIPGACPKSGIIPQNAHPIPVDDIDFEQLVSDPLVAAKSVYDHFELDLTAETEAAMQSHVTANPQGKHGAHEYDLAQYGLTPGEVESRLADYIGRFALC